MMAWIISHTCPQARETGSHSQSARACGEHSRAAGSGGAVAQCMAPQGTFYNFTYSESLPDGASKAIPGLYFIVTFICKGCQSGPELAARLLLTRSYPSHRHILRHLETHRREPQTCSHHRAQVTDQEPVRDGGRHIDGELGEQGGEHKPLV